MLKSSSLCLYSSNLGTFWLKIEQFWPFEESYIFSNGFELYKHNDEPFNIYYGIFYELWTFVDFDRLCKLEKRGDEIKKKRSGPYWISRNRCNFFCFNSSLSNLYNNVIIHKINKVVRTVLFQSAFFFSVTKM
jgi:hypothetical protein